jgi:hypothetical protein
MLACRPRLPTEVFFCTLRPATAHGWHDVTAAGLGDQSRHLAFGHVARAVELSHDQPENRADHFIDGMRDASKLTSTSDHHRAPRRTDWSDDRMSAEHPQVFAIDLGRRPAFVFAANGHDMAQSLVRSPGLLQALDTFGRLSRPAQTQRLALRKATNDEAAIYLDRADELAEETICRLLLVHISSG